MRPAKAVIWLASLAMVATVGCGSDTDSDAGRSSLRVPEGAPITGDFSGSGAGTLVSANIWPDIDLELIDASLLAARYTYVSTSGVTNDDVNVTGALFIPRGPKPPGGFPTIALAHPATGIQPECAPSLSRNLQKLASVVAQFLRAGFAVTVPDYQGLGNDDAKHPYLDSTTVGRNLIDSVTAARKAVRDLSDRWVGVGIGQGGQAAWAANDLAREFGGGLQLLGSVSVSPFSDLEGLADAAAAGTLTTEQKLVLVQYLAALKWQNDGFDLSAFRRGSAENNWDALIACDRSSAQRRATLLGDLSADDLRPSSPQAVDELRGYLRSASLPNGVTAAPMLVTYGAIDPLIPLAWTDQALVRACDAGDVIQIDRQDQVGPADIDVTRTIEWARARLSGASPTNDCAGFGAVLRGEVPPPPDDESSSVEESPTEQASSDETPVEETPVEEPAPTTTLAPTATVATPTTVAPTTVAPTTSVAPAAPPVQPAQPDPVGPLPGPPPDAAGTAVG